MPRKLVVSVRWRRAVAEQLPAHIVVDLHVGAAEAVDGLLRVADDEELPRHRTHGLPIALARVVGRQQQQKLGLQRIGVLELVHEDAGAPFLQLPARRSRRSSTRSRARCSRSKKSSSPRRAFSSLVEGKAAAQLVAQQRRQIRVGVALEDRRVAAPAPAGLVGRGPSRDPWRSWAIALPGAPEVAIPAQVDEERFGAVEMSPASMSIGSSSLARRAGAVSRYSGSRRLGGLASDRGERADAAWSGDRSRPSARSRARPRRVGKSRHSVSCQPAARRRSTGPSASASPPRRPARAPQRSPHAFGQVLRARPGTTRKTPRRSGAAPDPR